MSRISNEAHDLPGLPNMVIQLIICHKMEIIMRLEAMFFCSFNQYVLITLNKRNLYTICIQYTYAKYPMSITSLNTTSGRDQPRKTFIPFSSQKQ